MMRTITTYSKRAATGCGEYSSSLFSKTHIQRPGLLFANCGSSCGNANYVYVAFSMMDGNSAPYPNGFVFGYNATNLNNGTVLQFQTSNGNGDPSSYGGGIWQGGAGPAYGTDPSGNSFIYLNTGNGISDGSSNWGDSLLKLNPSNLTIDTSGGYGYFTPVDEFYRNDKACGYQDIDYGSGGVMLIPDGELLNWTYLAVSGDKEGGLWFANRTNLGGHNPSCDNSASPCNCPPPSPKDNNIQVYWTGTIGGGPPIHTSPAFWEYDQVLPELNYLFVSQQQTGVPSAPLTRYPLCATANAETPIDTVHCSGGPVSATVNGTTIINFGWGATPTVSANGTGATDAIVWATSKPDGDNSEGTTPGILYAIDAVSMHQLYSSSTCSSDQIAPATKYSVPTVANGHVYLGTQQTASCPGNGCYNTGAGNF